MDEHHCDSSCIAFSAKLMLRLCYECRDSKYLAAVGTVMANLLECCVLGWFELICQCDRRKNAVYHFARLQFLTRK